MVTLRPEEIYGLLGANGAGQSTILRLWAAERPGSLLVEAPAGSNPDSYLAALRQAIDSGADPLLLDEPTLGLDENGATEVCRLLTAATAHRSLAVATCSPGLVRELCRRVGFVRDGAVVLDGETATLLVPVGYVIEIRDRLDDSWADAFDGFELNPGPKRTRFVKEPCDQASLHGALRRIRDLGLKLVSVTPIFPFPTSAKE